MVAVGGIVAAPASADPPPGRAYELVSPAADPSGAVAGLSTDLLPLPAKASDDGDRLVYGAAAGLGSPWSGPANPMILGRRTATGWKATTAVRSLDEGNTPLELSSSEAQGGWLTPDGQAFVFGIAGNLGAAPVQPGSYLPGIFSSTEEGAPSWLSQPTGGIVAQPGLGVLAVSTTANREADVVAFSSVAPLTADAPPSGTSAVYAYYKGELQLASRLPDGSAATTASYMANTSDANAGIALSASIRNQLAGDGRFVLFRVGGSAIAAPLYVRDLEQQVTYHLAGGAPSVAGNAGSLSGAWSGSAAVDGTTVPNGSLVFGASDGDRAYFRAQGETLIREADLASGTVVSRPAITGAPVGLSPNGKRILFIDPPTTGSTEQWALRFWDADNPSTSVVVGELGAPTSLASFGRFRAYRSSEDGATWTFTAAGSPDPDRPNLVPTTQQVYRWEIGDAAPTCLSCESVDNVVRTSGVSMTVHETVATESILTPTTVGSISAVGTQISKRKLSQPGRSVSSDGRWVLFDSPDRLVDEDQNDVRDVYLWDRDGAPGGQLQLVTSGQGNVPSWALDLDASGDNAFFTTREGLVPGDRNGNYDVYVARVGGGFPENPDEGCDGESCRPAVIPDPPTAEVGSTRVSPVVPGKQQPVQSGDPKLRVRSVRTSSQRLTVRIDTPKAGKIRVTGKAVRTTSRTAKRATTYTLRVPLTASAKRQVASGRTVKAALRVSFTAKGAKASAIRTTVSVRKGR